MRHQHTVSIPFWPDGPNLTLGEVSTLWPQIVGVLAQYRRQIQVAWLPSDAQDLSPVEHVWNHTQYGELANIASTAREELAMLVGLSIRRHMRGQSRAPPGGLSHARAASLSYGCSIRNARINSCWRGSLERCCPPITLSRLSAMVWVEKGGYQDEKEVGIKVGDCVCCYALV